MKIKGAKAVHYDSGPNMTPLVDVVMVILIFLMLTGSFGAAAHFLPSSMPIKDKGKGQIDPSKIPKVPDPQLEILLPRDPRQPACRRAGPGRDRDVVSGELGARERERLGAAPERVLRLRRELRDDDRRRNRRDERERAAKPPANADEAPGHA